MINKVATLLAILFSIVSIVRSQETNCFTDDLRPVDGYVQDRVAYNLYKISNGSDVSYSISTSPEDKSVVLRQTFEDFTSFTPGKALSNVSTKCSTFTKVNNHLFAFICDSIWLPLIKINGLTGDIDSQNTLPLAKEDDCSSLASTKHHQYIFAVCKSTDKANASVIIYAFDTVNMNPIDRLIINQDAGEILSNNLVIEAVLGPESDETNVFADLYVFENTQGGDDVRIRIFNFTSGKANLQHVGFFSGSKGTIKNIAKETKFVTFKVDNYHPVLFVRNNSNANLIAQFCKFTIVSGVVCGNPQDLDIQVQEPSIVFHKLESLKDVMNVEKFVVASGAGASLFEYVQDSQEIVPSIARSVTTESSGIIKIEQVTAFEDRVYITGTNSEGKTVVVKWSELNNGNPAVSVWEKTVITNKDFDLAFIRKGTYDTEIDEFLAIKGNATFYSLIYEPTLLLQPYLLSDPLSATSIKAEVTCKAMGASGTKTTQLNYLPKLNSNSEFNVPPKLQAYSHSARIQMPIAVEDFRGNAPTFSLSLDGKEGAKFLLKYHNALSYKETVPLEFKDINGVRYVGEGLFLLENPTNLKLIGCAGVESESFTCLFEDWDMAKEGKLLLDATLIGDELFLLFAEPKAAQKDPKDLKVTISVSQINGEKKSPTIYEIPGIESKVGTLKQFGDWIYCMIAGDQHFANGTTSTNKLFSTRYVISKKSVEDISTSMDLGDHVCVKEMKYHPRLPPHIKKVFISSSCLTEDSARIYELDINTLMEDKKIRIVATIARQFNEINALKFEICPTGTAINVAVMSEGNSNIVYALEDNGSEYTRYSYEVRDYGVEKIVDFYCDQENKIFQVIGTDKEGKNPKLITYRGETQHQADLRIHSVQAIKEAPAFLASSYNLNFDEVNSLLLKTSIEGIQMHQIYTGAPWIEIKGVDIAGGEHEIVTKVTYPAKEGDVEVTKSTKLETVDYDPTVTIEKLTKEKEKLPEHGTINLDQHLKYRGPVVKFEMPKHDAAQLFDRLYPSEQFRQIKTKFDLVSVDEKFLLTYGDGVVSYYVNGESRVEVLKDVTVTAVKALGKGQGFAFLSKPKDAVNVQLVFLLATQDEASNGDTLKQYNYPLQSTQIEGMVVFKTATGSLFYSVFDSAEQSITSGLLKVRGDYIEEIGMQDYILNDNILMDLDGVILNQNETLDYVVLVYSEDQAKAGKMTLFSLDDDSFTKVNTQEGQLLEDASIHDMVDISCNSLRATNNRFDCFHSRENMYSHQVVYEVDFEKAKISDIFVSIKETKDVKNIYNFVPLRAAVFGKYIAVVAENKFIDKSKSSSIYSEAFILVVYNTEVQTEPYKVLDYKELGLVKYEDLSKLEPVFFNTGSDNKDKLAINVGSDDASIRVFNLEDMQLVITNGNDLSFDIVFTGLQVDGEKQTFKLSELFQLPQPPNPKPEDKKNHGFIVILIIIVVALVVIGIGSFFYWKYREREAEGAYASDETLRGGFESEHTIKADATSIVPA